MILRNALSIAVVSVIFAAPAVASAAPQDPAGQDPAQKEEPKQPKRSNASKYAGINDLIKSHREAQVKMVKLWRTIKAGQGDDKMAKDYEQAQVKVQEASNKVTQFINREHWSEADRAAMNKMWTDVLEKPID
jgi:hypothetical protein